MAVHSSMLVWRIPWTEELGRLQSIVSKSSTQLKRLSTHTARTQLIYDIVLVSVIQQSESVIHLPTFLKKYCFPYRSNY